MTINEIKEKLPEVKICLEGKTFAGAVLGRNNPYATVTIKNALFGIPYCSFTFSWAAIERAINNKTSLTI